MSKFQPENQTPEPDSSSHSQGRAIEGRITDVNVGPSSRMRSSAQHGISLRDDLTINDVVERIRGLLTIVRNRWLAGLLAAILSIAVSGYFYFRSEPEYTAVSTLLAQSPLDEILRSSTNGRSSQRDSQENFLHNHLSVMQSRRFSLALAKEFTHEERVAIVSLYMLPGREATMASFEQMLARRSNATRQRDREFFTLSFSHRDPDIAVMVADRMAATYLKLVQEEIRETNLAAAEVFRVQAEQLQKEISEIEEKQRVFREEHNIVSLQENQGFLAERMRRIDENRSKTRIELFRLETQLNDAKKDMGEDELPFHNPVLASFWNNQELREELDALQAQRTVMALRYGRNHPKMLDIDGKIEGVLENLKRNFLLAYRDLDNQYQSLASIEQQLDAEFKEEFGKGIEIGRLADQFLVIGGEVEAKRSALNDLLRRASNATVVSHLPADVMRVVDPAYVVQPRLAQRKLVALFSIFFVGGTFFGVPLFLHLFDQRLKCATDIEKELGKTLLGGIPGLSKIAPIDRPHVVRNNIDPSKAEPFMTIVAQLELTSSQEGSKSYVVTSTTTGEGKSTIASNLAAGFSQIGRKTLVVDGDLRRPCQHRFYRIRKEGGLVHWAKAGYPFDDLLDEKSPLGIVEVSNGSFVLPAGGIYSQPTQFLVSSHVEDLFKILKKHFDVIIVDSPPVGFYPDALVFAKSVDETILVARESKAPVKQIRRVIVDIESAASPIVGVVLNDYSPGSIDPRLFYGRNYEGYNYPRKNSNKNRMAPAAKTMVGRLMAEDEKVLYRTSDNQESETMTYKNLKESSAGKSLINKLKAFQKVKRPASGKSLISKVMSDEKL